jgi:predicted RNA binding protein YcfA (HicA-like mRNA interferase family)
MSRKVYDKVMSGRCDHNIGFNDFCLLIVNLGFTFKRQKGSHIQYFHENIKMFMNVQKDGSKAKGYEVKQLREIIRKHNLYV